MKNADYKSTDISKIFAKVPQNFQLIRTQIEYRRWHSAMRRALQKCHLLAPLCIVWQMCTFETILSVSSSVQWSEHHMMYIAPFRF